MTLVLSDLESPIDNEADDWVAWLSHCHCTERDSLTIGKRW